MAIKLSLSTEALKPSQFLTFKDFSVVTYGKENHKKRLEAWSTSTYSPVHKLDKIVSYFDEYTRTSSGSKDGIFSHCYFRVKMKYTKTLRNAIPFPEFEKGAKYVQECLSTIDKCGGKEGSLNELEKTINAHLKHLCVRTGGRGTWDPNRTTILFPSDIVFSKWEECNSKLDGYGEKIFTCIKSIKTKVEAILKLPTDKVKEDVLRDRVAFIDAAVKFSDIAKDIHQEWENLYKSAQP